MYYELAKINNFYPDLVILFKEQLFKNLKIQKNNSYDKKMLYTHIDW